MAFTLDNLLAYPIPRLADLMTRAFEGYLVPMRFTPESLVALLLSDGVSHVHSRIVLKAGEPVGVGLIARRGWACRLAGMGIVKPARRTGAGRFLLDALVEGARARGERELVLEVIEQNEPAVSLYRRAGFEVQRRLVGYKLASAAGEPDERLQEVDVREAVRRLVVHGPADLPWQLAPEAFAHMGRNYRAFRLGRAWGIVLDAPQADTALLQSLVVPFEARRQGEATRLVRALLAQLSRQTWRVPIVLPEDLAPGLFEGVGFERERLSQFQMRLDLTR